MRWWAEHALLPDGPASGVLLVEAGGLLTEVTTDAAPGDATRLTGVVLPGLADCHSHAFHRALRGRTHAGGGDFWTWRTGMYAVAARLDPDSYFALARAVYAEMVLAGITCVGEFHYLHHQPSGAPYADPLAMSAALAAAAEAAGIRLTLIDTLYLAGGLAGGGHLPLEPGQRRFADADAETWAARSASVRATPGLRTAAGLHSVRAVPAAAYPIVREAAAGRPLHLHLSEQPAENAACLAHHGRTPTDLVGDAGLLGPATTVVHATHLTGEDVTRLGATRTTACLCPTTERDLADGIGPARLLADAGAGLSLGSDQHAVIDLFEEARGLETHERLSSLQRGRFTPAALLDAATAHASLGWPDAGRLAVGARCDLVAVDLGSVRTAGSTPEQVLMSATAADVHTVVVDGRVVVRDHEHRLGPVGPLLSAAIEPLWAAS